MPRFFVPSSGFEGDSVSITGDDAFHMARSLRMAVGDTVTICDMHGQEHLCRLESLRDDICRLTAKIFIGFDRNKFHLVFPFAYQFCLETVYYITFFRFAKY